MGKGLWCLVIAGAIGVGWHLGRPTQLLHLPAVVGHESILSEGRAMARSVAKLQQVPAESLTDRLEKALEESKTGATFEIQLLLARAFQEDREGLRLWALRRRGEELDTVVRLWLRESPEAIWIEGRHSSRDTWNRAMTKALAAEDPGRFFEHYAENSHLKDRDSSLLVATQSLAQRDFERAETIVAGIENVQQAMVGLALAKAQKVPFQEAYAWASGLERGAETALAAVIDSLATSDVERALALFVKDGLSEMTSIPDGARKETRNALERLPREEVAALLERYPVKSFARLAMRELPSDPLEAAAMLDKGEPVAVSYAWRPRVERGELESTLNELASHTDSVVHQRVLKKTLSAQVTEHPDIVADWVSSLPEPEVRSHWVSQVIGRISHEHLPQLVNLVDIDDENESRLKHSAGRAAQRMTRQSPMEAFRMASQIEDAEIRAFALGQLEKTWKEYDETASLEALQLERDQEINAED